MSITELSGRPADPDCVHCTLGPVIDQFMREHPEVPQAQVIGHVAQVLGELIGSEAYNSGHTHCVLNVVTGASREVLRTALGLVEELKRRQS